jgi:HlyD family secretion protein
VSRVGFAVEADRTVRVEIDLPNADGNLRPGMIGRATLRLGAGPADAVRVPARSFFQLPEDQVVGDAKWAVYVYRDGRARLTPVRIDYQTDKEAEVRSGLKADDVVVEDLNSLGSLDGRQEVPVVGNVPEGK